MQYKRLQPVVKEKNHYGVFVGIGLALIALGLALYVLAFHRPPGNSSAVKTAGSSTMTLKPVSPQPPPNACAGSTDMKLILVSISKQHIWACRSGKTVYNAAVITGMALYPADLTPVGSYHIYAKTANTVLKGSDNTGSWTDPVSYWMPFLDNNYGTYGFHDASWRSATDFGHVNINSPYTVNPHGSHGCVESTVATAKWLYDLAPIGTPVTVES